MTINEGKIIVICAPSGTGKSTLIEKLKKDFPDSKWSVSCTTRKMRPGEKHGVDYFFIEEEDFKKKIEANNFIEWAKVHSNYYGTSFDFVEEGLKLGWRMLFDLDTQGADAMKKIYGDKAQVIFIEPPSIEELERRLIARGTEKIEVIKERVNNARREILRKNDYDFLIMNDDVTRAYGDLFNMTTKVFK